MKYSPKEIFKGYVTTEPTPSVEELEVYYREEFYQSEKPDQINDSSKEIRDRDAIFYNLQYSIFFCVID